MAICDVTVTREGDCWVADIPDVAGAHTYARTLSHLATSAREAIVAAADLPDDAAIELTFHVNNGDTAVAEAEQIHHR